MLNNFVLETCNAPGTASTVNLAGPPSGRVGFLQAFASGAQCFYFMDDGTQAEAGVATLAAGSPNTLARTTVLWNSYQGTNNPGRVNFTGATRVYNEVPAQRAVYLDSFTSGGNGSPFGGGSWFQLPGGLIIQGGAGLGPVVSGFTQFSFPKPFTSFCITCLANPSGGTVHATCQAFDKVGYAVQANGSAYINFMAIGY